jgi:hypothetical protein
VTDDMVVRKEDVGFDKTVARGVSKGRVMYLSRTPAFDAKNRYALPDKLPLNWQDLQDALTSKTPKD